AVQRAMGDAVAGEAFHRKALGDVKLFTVGKRQREAVALQQEDPAQHPGEDGEGTVLFDDRAADPPVEILPVGTGREAGDLGSHAAAILPALRCQRIQPHQSAAADHTAHPILLSAHLKTSGSAPAEPVMTICCVRRGSPPPLASLRPKYTLSSSRTTPPAPRKRQPCPLPLFRITVSPLASAEACTLGCRCSRSTASTGCPRSAAPVAVMVS